MMEALRSSWPPAAAFPKTTRYLFITIGPPIGPTIWSLDLRSERRGCRKVLAAWRPKKIEAAFLTSKCQPMKSLVAILALLAAAVSRVAALPADYKGKPFSDEF